jgi:hypothetical protein
MALRLKWGTPEDLAIKIDDYFETDQIPTVTGLCIFLDISIECFSYYANKRYKYKRKSAEEKETILKEMEEQQEILTEMEALEDFVTITDKMEVIDNFDARKRFDEKEEDTIKRQASEHFKKARLRIEDWTVKNALTSKSPVGSIFLLKSQYGYREADAVAQQQSQLMPTKIVIEVLQAAVPNAQIQSKD